MAGLTPLHDRIRFLKQGAYASIRQAQLELVPFDAERLRSVALRLRELYPCTTRGLVEERVSDAFIDRLVAEVTKGFRGDVGVVPRQFLREFVTQLDLVEENKDYIPMETYGCDPGRLSGAELTPEEQQYLGGSAAGVGTEGEGDEAELIPAEDVW